MNLLYNNREKYLIIFFLRRNDRNGEKKRHNRDISFCQGKRSSLSRVIWKGQPYIVRGFKTFACLPSFAFQLFLDALCRAAFRGGIAERLVELKKLSLSRSNVGKRASHFSRISDEGWTEKRVARLHATMCKKSRSI